MLGSSEEPDRRDEPRTAVTIPVPSTSVSTIMVGRVIASVPRRRPHHHPRYEQGSREGSYADRAKEPLQLEREQGGGHRGRREAGRGEHADGSISG
jgi:hypothetical protein